jgi:hypothetical protein
MGVNHRKDHSNHKVTYSLSIEIVASRSEPQWSKHEVHEEGDFEDAADSSLRQLE